MNGDNWPAIASHIMGHADIDQMHDALLALNHGLEDDFMRDPSPAAREHLARWQEGRRA